MRPPSHQFGTLAQPLDNILGTIARVRVLRALDRAAHPMTIVALQKETRLAYNAVNKAAKSLAQAGLAAETPTGSGTVFGLNQNHPFSAGLQALFTAERARRRAVERAVETWADEQKPSPLAVWLFGSVARKEDTFSSDIDLAVVGRDKQQTQGYAAKLRETLSPIAERHLLRPSILPYDATEILGLRRENAAMWANLTRDAVPLYGPEPNALRNQLRRSRPKTRKSRSRSDH
jgi:predicted nucleotidyltransferase